LFDPAALAAALDLFLNWQTFLWMIIGVFVGTGVGAIPGLTASTGIAVMLPVAFFLPVAPALGLIIGVYKGAIYGGSISAVSFGVPGTPGAAATVYDGYKLTQKGQGRKGLEMALYASITGDTLSDIFTIFVAPMVAVVALAFGPTEKVWLLMLGMVLIGALTGKHLLLGLMSAIIGVFLASIGRDPMAGVTRMTFGQWWLMDGIHLIPLVIGIFAMPVILLEAAKLLGERRAAETGEQEKRKSVWKTGPGLSFQEFWRTRKELGIGTVIGSFIGMLPGLGSTPAAFLSYALAKHLSPYKKIGTGVLEGVAAPESGNNATCGPTLIPLLAFGIPGSPAAALIGGALMLHGATPGPRMFVYYPDVIYALFMILLVANIVNLGIGRIFARVYATLAQFPKPVLIPLILMLAIIGAYAARANPYDIVIMLFLGILGFGMIVVDMPTAPLVIAFILTPMVEENLRRALIMNPGNPGKALFGSPLAIGLILAMVVLVFFTVQFLKKVEE